MKKMLACLTALLMMVLPALSMAEGLSVLSAGQGFAGKYLAEGQGHTVDISLELGDFALSNMDEQTRGIVKELMDALKIELESQKNGSDLQGALRILLNDQNAADVVIAMGEKGLYAASSFLGEKVFMITKEQISKLAESQLDQMVAQGTLSQEQADQLKAALNGTAGSGEDLIASMFGSPDFQPLLSALQELVSTPPAISAVEEIPEGVTIDAAMKMTIVLGKESLTKVTTELAKLLWSFPVVQQIANASAANNGAEPMTEEKLTEALNRIPAALSDDLTLDIYADAAGQQIQALSDLEVTANGQTVPIHVNELVEMKENGAHVHTLVRVAGAENPATMDMDLNVAVEGTETAVDMDLLMQSGEGDQAAEMMRETMRMTVSRGETENAFTMEMSARAAQNGSGEPMTVRFTANGTEKDLGDHAEENAVITAAIDGLGDVLKVTMNAKTDLAEAWIIVDDAVQPLSMTQEELQQLSGELSGSAMGGLMKLVGLLPANAQTLVFQMMNGVGQ